MADGGLDKKRQQFEDAQLKELEIPKKTENIEEVLASAEKIGIISKDVVEKIKGDKTLSESLGSSFKKTFDNAKTEALTKMKDDTEKTAEDKEKIAKAKAFREAFRMVYGRFMLERAELSDPQNGAILERLKGVLKFEIDEHGVKTRPELQAAIARLKFNLSPRWKAVKDSKILEAENEKASLTKKKDVAEGSLKDLELDRLSKSIEGPISEYVKAHPKLKEFEVAEREVVDLEAKLSMIDFFTKIPLLDEQTNPDSMINGALSMSENEFAHLRDSVQTNQSFARRILGIGTDKILSQNDVRLGLKRMRKIFHGDRFIEQNGYTDIQRKRAEEMFLLIGLAGEKLNAAISDGNVGAVENPFVKRDEKAKDLDKKRAKRDALAKSLIGMDNFENDKFNNFESLLDGFKDKIEILKNNPNISDKIRELCSKYLEDYKVWKESSEQKSTASILNFQNKIFKVFVSDLKNSFSSEIKSFGDGIGAASLKIDQFQKDIIPADVVDSVLAKALPKSASGAEIKRLERLHHEAEHHEHELHDVYKYFSSHDSFTKVVEISGQLEGAIKDWERGRDENVDAIDAQISKLGTADKDAAEKLVLEKKKGKAGLDINARLSYLKEQISLKEKSTLSDAEIQRIITDRIKAKGGAILTLDERTNERKTFDDENQKKAEERGEMKEELERLNLIIAKSKEFRAELAKLIDNAAKAEHLGIDLKKHVGAKKDKKGDAGHHKEGEHADATNHDKAHEHHEHGMAAGMVTRLQGINLDNRDFNPSSLIGLYTEFNGLFGDGHKVQSLLEEFDAASAKKAEDTKKAKKDLEKATASAEKGKNLTDADASKRIIGALVGEQFPDMSPMDHNKLVTMILAEDVATLQTDEGYAELAQRGTAEAMETGKFANVSARLLNFKYKEGDKVTQPLKGIKPDDLKDWESIEKLFTFGKLNYKNAFFVLVAFQDFDGDVKSIQSVKLEKKLKGLLAKQMGVDAHMDKAGISKVVDDAFKAQMEKIRPIMKAHFSIVETKGGKAKENKKKVLDMKYEDLNDQFRSGKFSSEIYDHKLEALIKEAKEADVNVEFSADSVGSKYWNSPYAQWLKDKAHDSGVFLGKKALAAGVFAPLKIAGKGVWGATKLGTALGLQTALLPVRAAKYPLLLAAKPLVGFINLFRANKWTPLPGLRDSVKNDTARIMGYAKEKATGVAKGTAETVTGTVSGEWGKVKYADTKYADRNKKKADERAELMKIHEPKSDLEAIEVPDSPFVDLAKYKKQIDMVATALGIKIDAPHGAEVKVGHEEKKDDHAKPHDAAHGAHDAHGEKKDDHAKPDAHAAKVDDHAKHDDHKKAA